MPPSVVTFYSYKGGVGRTFALANISVILAQWGCRVLTVDWDIEAPGLAHYFSKFDFHAEAGVVEFLEHCSTGEPYSWSQYASQVAVPKASGSLHLMPANASGRCDYHKTLQMLDWDGLYLRHRLGEKLEALRTQWLKEFDIILIDSRTGITDFNGITTAALPDILMFFVSSNQQSLRGCCDVVRRAIKTRLTLPFDRPTLLPLPIIAKFENREEYDRAQTWRKIFANDLEEFITTWAPKSIDALKLIDFLSIPYVPRWSFGEELAVILEGESTPRSPTFPVSYTLETVAALLVNRFDKIDLLLSSRDEYVLTAKAIAQDNLFRNDDPIKVFISYDRGDAKIALRIHEFLTDLGAEVFSDFDAEAGASYWGKITECIEASDVILAILGNNFSRFQEQEIERCIRQHLRSERDKLILPILQPKSEATVARSRLAHYQGIFVKPDIDLVPQLAPLIDVLERRKRVQGSLYSDIASNLNLRLSANSPRNALDAAVRAVELNERLIGTRPDKFLPELATSKLNLATVLSNLGRREEALAATVEAVDIYRRLAEARPDAFFADLSLSLNNLGNRLSELGRREEALAATAEAVDTYRRLAVSRPDAFLPDLAASLNNLGMMLSNLGRREEALAATAEAVDIRRRLAQARPDAFLPDLATSLNNISVDLSNLGRREKALAATAEAVDIRRRLAEARPDAFLPDLAMSLNNLGNRLSDLGRWEEALAATAETVDIRRRLAEARPDAFLPDLAMSLNNLGNGISALGRREEALAATAEAVDIYRRLAEARPDAFLPDLAMSLNNLGNGISALGRREEALAATAEAVDIRRRLAEARPDAFLPDLATSLNNLGNRLSDLGRREEALAATAETVDIRRRLAEARPDAFLPDLAMSLGAMGNAHLVAEQFDTAAAAFEEGLTVIAPFVERHSQAFGDLARNLGQYYLQACEKAGREPDAALLERVARALGGDDGGSVGQPAIPDETVRALMAHPDLQEGLTAFMRENNLEGAPADLPIETQRALAAAIVEMAEANGAGEPATANEPAPAAPHPELLPEPAPAPEPPAAARPKRGWWFRHGT